MTFDEWLKDHNTDRITLRDAWDSALSNELEYKDFHTWFNELEGFALRSERFYADVMLTLDPAQRASIMLKWIESAFNAGREREYDAS